MSLQMRRRSCGDGPSSRGDTLPVDDLTAIPADLYSSLIRQARDGRGSHRLERSPRRGKHLVRNASPPLRRERPESGSRTQSQLFRRDRPESGSQAAQSPPLRSFCTPCPGDRKVTEELSVTAAFLERRRRHSMDECTRSSTATRLRPMRSTRPSRHLSAALGETLMNHPPSLLREAEARARSQPKGVNSLRDEGSSLMEFAGRAVYDTDRILPSGLYGDRLGARHEFGAVI